MNKMLFKTALVLCLTFIIPIDACTSSPIKLTDSNTPSNDMRRVVAQVRPSVVVIDFEETTHDYFNNPQTVQGAGSGWTYSKDGYIVTNNHVVEDATTIKVTLNDGGVFSAESVKGDDLSDLAVIKINAGNLKAAVTGDSSKIVIADWVVAIGNSLGLGISATVGVIGALDVTLQESPGRTLHGLIQHDAATNPGNSGGPLVNSLGQVIGINSAKVEEIGVEGMGYAISINEALPIIQTLIQKGYVVRPSLGINVIAVNSIIQARYDLPVDNGILITDIVPGGPAERAGLAKNDVITAIEDRAVDCVCSFVDVLNAYDIGKKIKVTYWRGISQNIVSTVLDKTPPPQQ